MNTKTVSRILLTLLITGMLAWIFNIQPVKAEPRAIIVPDDHPTIQGAINNANEGDTIFVRADIYYEHLIIDKSVSLIGENKHNTIIDGSLAGETVVIAANNVTFSFFTVRNNDFGVVLGYWYPLYWSSNRSTISHNIVTDSLRSGITLLGNCNENVISNNIVINNGGHGIGLGRSSSNKISKNTISLNKHSGIRLDPLTEKTVVCGNILTNNTYGINIYQSSGNRIYHNNFVNNTYQVYSYQSVSVWDDGYPSGGNYWSDQYHGDCADHCSGLGQDIPGSDGIVDTPYAIDENNQDTYPFMKPWGMPLGMSADLVRRRAWPEHHHFVLSKDGEPTVEDRHGTPGYQTLYGMIENTGNVTIPAATYKVVWNISSIGSTTIAETVGALDLAPREITVLTYDVPAKDLAPGKYHVETRCYYYYAMEGERTKTFSFTVVP